MFSPFMLGRIAAPNSDSSVAIRHVYNVFEHGGEFNEAT
jgi:hypothetical protein